LSVSNLFCYVNSDIILMRDCMQAIQRVAVHLLAADNCPTSKIRYKVPRSSHGEGAIP
jgi:hypothetical protein